MKIIATDRPAPEPQRKEGISTGMVVMIVFIVVVVIVSVIVIMKQRKTINALKVLPVHG